uniref:hypothetical protein n=1 Tax=Amycolatopsis sp. CA-096443 TaxID=3239919 RepID=UPI003F496633
MNPDNRPTRAELTEGGWLDPKFPGWVQAMGTEGEDSEGELPFGIAPDYLSPDEARAVGHAYLAAADYAQADRG